MPSHRENRERQKLLSQGDTSQVERKKRETWKRKVNMYTHSDVKYSIPAEIPVSPGWLNSQSTARSMLLSYITK